MISVVLTYSNPPSASFTDYSNPKATATLDKVIVFIGALHFSNYYFHRREISVMEMTLINFLFNNAHRLECKWQNFSGYKFGEVGSWILLTT